MIEKYKQSEALLWKRAHITEVNSKAHTPKGDLFHGVSQVHIVFQLERWFLGTPSQLPAVLSPLSYTHYPWNEFKRLNPSDATGTCPALSVASMSVPVTFVPSSLLGAPSADKWTPFPHLLQTHRSGHRIPQRVPHFPLSSPSTTYSIK